jgi:hypothetical protein
LLPAALREAAASPSAIAADYLQHCTTAADRVLIVGYAPEILALAERRFAGGRPSVVPGFYNQERYVAFMVRRLELESVPLVLAEAEGYYGEFPALGAYLRDFYMEEGMVPVDGGRSLRLLARRGRPMRPYGLEGWPCAA